MKIEAYAFILDFEFQREKKNDEIHKLTFRSDILDYFYRPQKSYIKNVSELIRAFDKEKIRKRNFKKYEFVFNKKKYLLYFGINSYLAVGNKFIHPPINCPPSQKTFL